MISAAGVRYIVGILRVSRFQQCTVRVLQTRKIPAMCQPKANVQYPGTGTITVDLYSNSMDGTTHVLRGNSGCYAFGIMNS